MAEFAMLPVAERALILEGVAARLGVVPIIVEKDYWVCWILERLFELPVISGELVFKGGTSLSKVYAVIDRFSEDVDLCVVPTALGFREEDLDDAATGEQRRTRMTELGAQCFDYVRDTLCPALEREVKTKLGSPAGQAHWLELEFDAQVKSPVVWFEYPSALPETGGYIRKRVKIEIGSLTRQCPTSKHRLKSLVGDVLGDSGKDRTPEIVVLDLVRTFWEKATILHAEYHRPIESPLRNRSARHFSDFVALWRHSSREDSMRQLDILLDVTTHKHRFFKSSWSSYPTARPGSFRLVPPDARRAELERDYKAMRSMFINEPIPFDALIAHLADAEAVINGRGLVSDLRRLAP